MARHIGESTQDQSESTQSQISRLSPSLSRLKRRLIVKMDFLFMSRIGFDPRDRKAWFERS